MKKNTSNLKHFKGLKKNRINPLPSLFLMVFLIAVISGCEKNYSDVKSKLIGIWISTDLTDTIEFSSDHDFYKIIYNIGDHYDYTLSKDSIFIKYIGTHVPFIYLGPPKKHFYQLDGDMLTIDYRPYCFGFVSQTITYSRK